MSLTLYALTEQYQKLQEMLAAGEVDEATFADTMKSLEGDITTKVDNLAAVLRTMELECDAYRYEEVRLAERRKALENNRDRLRRYALFELEQMGLKSVKGSRFFVTVQDSTPKVVVDDEQRLPPDFWKETRSLDKAAISTALKSGTEVPGAHLETVRSLRIR